MTIACCPCLNVKISNLVKSNRQQHQIEYKKEIIERKI